MPTTPTPPVEYFAERIGPMQWVVRSRFKGSVRDEIGPVWTEAHALEMAAALTHCFAIAFELGQTQGDTLGHARGAGEGFAHGRQHERDLPPVPKVVPIIATRTRKPKR